MSAPSPVAKAQKRPSTVVVQRLQRVAVGLGLLYTGAVLLVLTPLIQTLVLYATHIDVIGYSKFEHPEHYGLAPGKTINMALGSSDNVTLGAWFVFSDPFYRKLPHPHLQTYLHTRAPAPPTTYQSIQQASKDFIPEALKHNPTVLFLHGNSGTRAHHLRTDIYSGLTARLGVNVFAIDYRGFGDSTGEPSVQGVGRDARAGFDYLVQNGANPENILIIGHSLGTAIAGLLAAELGREGVRFRGVVLMSPFSSVRTLMDQYHLFGFLPLLKPLSRIPFMPRVITWSVKHNFDTLTLVPDIQSPALIAHAGKCGALTTHLTCTHRSR
ncbi:abhydrolase domain-containing protein 12 [Coprinopsis cinerea AmutBmut pab1-1]|nr:abhydrolase domain-containing protein 12 [Coprinopsis cinerea AmutBmut pab1-1]